MSGFNEYEYILSALADKRGEDIAALDLGEQGTFSDVFILATGNSEVHMRTLMDAAGEAMSRRGLQVRAEGEESANWRLLDGGAVTVHVFSRKGREFYKLEKLWDGAEVLRYETRVQEGRQ